MKLNVNVEIEHQEGSTIFLGRQVATGSFRDGEEFTIVDTGSSIVVYVGIEHYMIPFRGILEGVEAARKRGKENG